MKKMILGCAVMAFLIACGSGDSKTKDRQPASGDLSKNPDYQKGLDLVAKHKCMTCHAVDQTITGPAYNEVAKRYAGRPDTIVPYLAGKIIKGGSGEWGEVFMTPNSNVSQEEAEAMVKYILLLRQ